MNIDQVRSRLRFVASETRVEAECWLVDPAVRRRLIRYSAQLSHAATMRQMPQDELEVLLEAGIVCLASAAAKRLPTAVLPWR